MKDSREKAADLSKDVETLEALALHIADAIGEAGGKIVERRDKLQDETLAAWAERDTARLHLRQVLAILERMGWAPTFAQDADAVERARAWASQDTEDEPAG